SSDESEFSSIEELQRTKKKKSRVIHEEDLSKEERTQSEVISTLCEMYKCNIHATPCFIQENRHLQLNPARLQLWACEIVRFSTEIILFCIIKIKIFYYFYYINKGTTYEIPPSYPTFDVKSSISINKNNLVMQAQVSHAPTTPVPIIIQLPFQFYQHSTFQE
ncbi:hypothetical protein RclHR1_42720001, partial [Rhizophagus clarus]